VNNKKRIGVRDMFDKVWDIRFLKLAREISTWSKDPSTKVGAVITDNNKRIISMGFNGFSVGVNDDEERYNNRELKYKLVQHAESNAIIFAKRDLHDHSIYVYPMFPCIRCTGMIIQSGISKIISIEATDDLKSRWESDIMLSMNLLNETNKKYKLYDILDLDGVDEA